MTDRRDGSPETARRPSPTGRPEPLLVPARAVRRSRPTCWRTAAHDAPLSPRGRILFWAIVVVLVVGIAVLLVVNRDVPVAQPAMLAIASSDVTPDTLTR